MVTISGCGTKKADLYLNAPIMHSDSSAFSCLNHFGYLLIDYFIYYTIYKIIYIKYIIYYTIYRLYNIYGT